MDFKLTLYDPGAWPFTSRRVLAWFTFEAPDLQAAIVFAREHYGPTIDETDCAILRPTGDDRATEVFLKGKSSASV